MKVHWKRISEVNTDKPNKFIVFKILGAWVPKTEFGNHSPKICQNKFVFIISPTNNAMIVVEA